MLPTPLGFVTLLEAVEAAHRKLADKDSAIRMIAEACENGKLAAGYRSAVDGGAGDLDRRVWQMPQWRSFFETGTIDLDLPLLDERGRPDPAGFTARCTREIFVRRDDVDKLVAHLDGPKGKGGRPRKFDQDAVAAEVRRLMDHHGEFSTDDPDWNAQIRLVEAVRYRFGEASDSTLEEYIKQPLAHWRAQKHSSPKT